MASNLVYHARKKNIEFDLHFVRDMVAQKQVEIRYVPNVDQIADALTKILSMTRFLRLKDKLYVKTSPSSLRGGVETETKSAATSAHESELVS